MAPVLTQTQLQTLLDYNPKTGTLICAQET